LETRFISDLKTWRYKEEILSPDAPPTFRLRDLKSPPFQSTQRDLPERGWLHFRLLQLSSDDFIGEKLHFEIVTPHGTKSCTVNGADAQPEVAFNFFIEARH
jgi:hypothetical protein